MRLRRATVPTETITRVGETNANWQADYIPEDDVEPCICSKWGPCRYHEKLLESKKH
jgi:hypothetical protein